MVVGDMTDTIERPLIFTHLDDMNAQGVIPYELYSELYDLAAEALDEEREACADLLAKMAEKQVWRKAIPEATILHHARQAILNRKNKI